MKGRFPRSRCFEKCELRATERHCLSPGEGGRIGNMDEQFVRTLEYVSPSGIKTPCDSFPAHINTDTGEVVGEDDPLGTWQMPMECISMCRWNYDDEKCYTSCEMRENEESCIKGGCDWDATPSALFGPGKVAQFGAIPFGTPRQLIQTQARLCIAASRDLANALPCKKTPSHDPPLISLTPPRLILRLPCAPIGIPCTGIGLSDGIPTGPQYDGLEGGRAVESVRDNLATIQREKAQALGYGWPDKLGGSNFNGPVSDCVLESHLRGLYEQGKTEAELEITAPARAAACYESVGHDRCAPDCRNLISHLTCPPARP